MEEVIYPGNYAASNKTMVEKIRGMDPKFYLIYVGSTLLQSINDLKSTDIFTLKFKLLGGKGGFGSLLRSFRINKSSNQLMCRDLTGRRLADVKEEERLRKWIAKKEERDKAEKRKDEEKLEKLRSGCKIKYHFKDKKYMRQRDTILESTEDAVEAGILAEQEKAHSSEREQSSKSLSPEKEEVEATSGSDIELDDDLLHVKKSRKRKALSIETSVIEEKKLKTEEIVLKNQRTGNKSVVAKAIIEETKQAKTSSKAEKEVDAVKEHKIVEIKEYDPIDIMIISHVKELEEFGLDHLKHELECRGLKCGGSLSERAARLFSIKDLTPDQYPKKIRAVKK